VSRVRVEVDELARLADRMAVVGAQLACLHEDVVRRSSVLDWHGAAAAEQAEARRQWVAGAARLDEGLADLRAAVRVARGNYVATVQANRRMWGR
jgi:hypothetical protein